MITEGTDLRGPGGRNQKLLVAAAVLSTTLGVACVAASWRRLSATFDEPNHLAAGLEWLQQGRYTLWTENPPLARVALAAIPSLAGARLPPREAWVPRPSASGMSWTMGTDQLYRDGAYGRNLAQARAGTVAFFVLAVLMIALLTARLGAWPAGALAALATATLPRTTGSRRSIPSPSSSRRP
jgi:hypothetical protein